MKTKATRLGHEKPMGEEAQQSTLDGFFMNRVILKIVS
jgi:hypothetical protein